MSKLYNKYMELKSKNPKKVYLFKSGIFYIFIDNDAHKVSPLLNLKLTNLSETTLKCGFPASHLDKYIELLNSADIDYSIIYNLDSTKPNYNYELLDELLDSLIKIDIDSISISEIYAYVENAHNKAKKIKYNGEK